jgi:hypothetical protein
MAAAGMIGSSFMGKSYASTAITDTDQVITPTAITNPDCAQVPSRALKPAPGPPPNFRRSRLTAGGRWIRCKHDPWPSLWCWA